MTFPLNIVRKVTMEIQMDYPEGPGNVVRERTAANAPMRQNVLSML